MGVPRLFPWVKKNFPSLVRHFAVGEVRFHVDYLYIDANGLLHTAAQHVHNYGDNARLVDVYADLTSEEKLKETFDVFLALVREVVGIASPGQVLVLALDGPAPLAKQAQQRHRRFVAAQERAGSSRPSNFDSNCITPGTEFMSRLAQYLDAELRNALDPKIATGSARDQWKFEVYFSPPSVPGEGEHKIMNFIRSLPQKTWRTAKHCFFGLDADLIMLSLAAPCTKITLLREDQYHAGYYHTVAIEQLRRHLAQRLCEPEERAAVEDFIILGFFVGNDFLPKIQMFLLLEDGLDKMISTRKRRLTGPDGRLDLRAFGRFVRELANQEAKYLERQSFKRMPAKRFVNHTLRKCVHGSQGRLDYEQYRSAYYEKAGIIAMPGEIGRHNARAERQVRQLCADYVRGFQWVAEYYLHGLVSWTWSYTWHYAPLLQDLAGFLEEHTEPAVFTEDHPSLPFVQLLSVLPASSARLLPRPFRWLFRSRSSPLVRAGYFPASFVVDLEGKTKNHMGVALLPFVSRDVVREGYAKVKGRVNQSARNLQGSASTLSYQISTGEVTTSKE